MVVQRERRSRGISHGAGRTTVRRQMLLFLGAAFVGLFLVLYVLTRATLLTSFLQLEASAVRQGVDRALGGVSLELAELASIAGDWGTWDATWRFVIEKDEEYVRENLTPSAFVTLRVDLMLFADARGEVIATKAIDREAKGDAPFPERLLGYLESIGLLARLADRGRGPQGVISLPEGPLLIASSPILPSSGEGAAQGTLVVGRYLDALEVARLSEALQLRLAVHRLADVKLPAGPEAAVTRPGARLVWPVNQTTVRGYAVLPDLAGAPALALEVEMPREIYAQWRGTLLYVLLGLTVSTLAFGGIFLLLLEKNVLSRLAQLARAVRGIREGGDLETRVPVSGKDELAALAGEVNGMLDRLAEARTRVEESEEQYRSLFEQSRDAIYITTRDGRFVDINGAGLDLFGYTKDEIRELNARQLYVDPAERERFVREVAGKGFVRDYPVRLRKKDGQEMDCLLSTTVRRASDGTVLEYRGLVRDVTERKRAEERLTYLATHDALTDLPNRGTFGELLALEIAHAKRDQRKVAVLFIDLDRFKEVNDTLGHATGDVLLREVAARLRRVLRASDSVARLGGDEFLVLLSGISRPTDAVAGARKVLDSLRQPFVADGVEVRVTVSIGIALYPDHGESADTLVKRADTAMYSVKDEGRDGARLYSPAASREREDPSTRRAP